MAANIFVNHNEHRMRALWRLILQAVIFIAGMFLASTLLGLVVVLSLVVSGHWPTSQQTILSMSNQPLMRIFSSLGTLLAMLLSYWVAARWIDRRPFKDFGFHFSPRWWADFGFGLFLGAVMMLLIFLVEKAAGWITVTGTFGGMSTNPRFWEYMLAGLISFICVGIYEEMFSRGYQLRNLAEGLNLRWLNPRAALLLAYLLSSSVFGMLHLGNPNASAISTIDLVVAGLFLGLGYMLTGDLAISIGLHITWNFFEGNVFGFAVSGTTGNLSLINIQQGGPDLWTGGAFGPEAGLTCLLVMVVGCLLTFLWVRWRYGKINLKETLAIYRPKAEAEPALVPPEPIETPSGDSL